MIRGLMLCLVRVDPVLKFFSLLSLFFQQSCRSDRLSLRRCGRRITVFSGWRNKEKDNGVPWMSPEKLLDFHGKTRARVDPFPPLLYLSDPLRVRSFFLSPFSFVLSPFMLEKVFSSRYCEIYGPCVALEEHEALKTKTAGTHAGILVILKIWKVTLEIESQNKKINEIIFRRLKIIQATAKCFWDFIAQYFLFEITFSLRFFFVH